MAAWELAVGSALKQHRRAARMTQEELAERANYSASYVSQIERGEKAPTPATIDLLALALGLDAEQAVALHRRLREGRPQRRPQLFTLPPLPTPLTSLIGRDALIAELRREVMLPSRRLLTLTGSAGVGKTRLALELGRRLQLAGELAVAFIPLDTLNDAALVAPTIARLLGVQIRNDEPLTGVIAALAESGPLLMTLDNFEHVTAAGPAIAELLRACPGVRVVATSRVPLALQGEHTISVPPLETPVETGTTASSDTPRASSLELLIERIAAVNHHFAPTPTDILTLGAIARRLDGLPLALELVAARSALLSPQELLSRLTSERIFHTLTSGARDLPDRQRTLYGALRWSYDLLDASAQRLFRGLAVLAGGTLGAAHAITLPGASEQRFLDAVESLVASNLISIERDVAQPTTSPVGATGADAPEDVTGDGRRIALLQTMRDFGWRCLREQREDRALRQRHADYFVAWGERMELELLKGRDSAFNAVEREIENVRAALRWLQETAQAPAGQRLASALGKFWDVRGYWREGLHWLLVFVAPGTAGLEEGRRIRSKTLRYASVLALNMSDLDQASALANEALDCAADDLVLEADVINVLASIAYARGDTHLARQYDERQLALYRQAGDEHGVVRALNNLAGDLNVLGRQSESIALYEEAVALARHLGDVEREAVTLSNLCMPLGAVGQYERAREAGQAALAIIERIGAPPRLAHCLTNLGDIEFRAQSLDAAWSYFDRSLGVYQQLGESSGVALTYYNLGCVAQARDDSRTALELFDQARLYYDPPDAQRLDALVLTGLADVYGSAQREIAMRYLIRGLTIAQHVGMQDVFIEGMETLASLMATDTDLERREAAAKLLGALQHEREHQQQPFNWWTRRKVERTSGFLVTALGQARYDALFADGASQPIDGFVARYLNTQ